MTMKYIFPLMLKVTPKERAPRNGKRRPYHALRQAEHGSSNRGSTHGPAERSTTVSRLQSQRPRDGH